MKQPDESLIQPDKGEFNRKWEELSEQMDEDEKSKDEKDEDDKAELGEKYPGEYEDKLYKELRIKNEKLPWQPGYVDKSKDEQVKDEVIEVSSDGSKRSKSPSFGNQEEVKDEQAIPQPTFIQSPSETGK